MKTMYYIETVDELMAILNPVRSKDDQTPFVNPATHRLVLEQDCPPRIIAIDGGLSLFVLSDQLSIRAVVEAAFKQLNHLINIEVCLS